MFSHRRSLPTPEAFDPQVLGSHTSGEKKASAPGAIHKTEHGMTKARYAQDITVLLLDDMPLTRECLSLSINLCDRGLHVQTAASIPEARAILQGDAPPDVVLCNFSGLPSADANFASRFRKLTEVHGRIPLIVLSDRDDADSVLEVLHLGARGYIPTSVGLSVALEALRLVAAGGTFVPTTFLHRLMQDQGTAPVRPSVDDETPPAVADGRLNGLTPRQLAVMKCLQEGKPNKIIAHELGMRESTVKVHVRSILKKLGATNRTEAVYRTMRDTE
jgi:Response regulator containing a CheY-like receiver domain and an HTH DNA-binding domain